MGQSHGLTPGHAPTGPVHGSDPGAWHIGPVRVLVVLAAAVASLGLAASAGAAIVVQKGIAGAQLHMTKAQVRAKLGAPKSVQKGRNEFGHYTTFVYPRVTVSFQGDARVTAVRTMSPAERTVSGAGVGSSEAKVKAAVPSARCGAFSGSRQCIVGAFKPGRAITAFQLKNGHVTWVVVGIVLD
jgi:hypothetical protein